MPKLPFLKEAKTPDIFDVTIKKVFEEKDSGYGPKKNCVVDYAGLEYYLDFKPKDYHIAVEGNRVTLVKKLYDGKPYFEKYSGGDGQTAKPNIVHDSQPNPVRSDDVEGKVRHGVACAYITAGKPLNQVNKEEMQGWIDYIINGK